MTSSSGSRLRCKWQRNCNKFATRFRLGPNFARVETGKKGRMRTQRVAAILGSHLLSRRRGEDEERRGSL